MDSKDNSWRDATAEFALKVSKLLDLLVLTILNCLYYSVYQRELFSL